ncbi:MAG: hypothetical protein QME90_19890, partial [Thermodesulfobacteriota bacterium]|nr:hypothetical protein [Thermodesulfobacteriota bacterium]
MSQNNSTLVEIQDQYEVAIPKVSVSVTVPEVVGNEEFPMSVEMKNAGKVEATVQFGVQSSEFGDSQTITLSAGETKLLQYQQQIRQNMDYTFTFTGDLELTLTKTVHYGLGASIAMNPQVLSPEGNVTVPVTITNTGQLDETIEINFE